MQLDSLQAISPIDGRYWSQAESLVPYFSEEALIRYRVRIEILYFIALSEELPTLGKVLNEERIEHLAPRRPSPRAEQVKVIDEEEAVWGHPTARPPAPGRRGGGGAARPQASGDIPNAR